MSRKYINRLLVLFISFSLFGCKDFIEKNISEDTPILVLPSNNATINANPVHIKWEELEGATKYRIEIVSPEFGNIQSFPLDSIVTGTNFYFGLDSAQYEIRITAMNAGFSSKPSAIKRFWVGTSQGGGNSVVLLSPNGNAYDNEDFNGNFSWGIVANAESYTFELHESNTFAGPNVIPPIDQIGITGINAGITGNDLAEGTYCWGVKAYLIGGGETNFSKRIFYIDKTNSPLASLSSPSNNSAISTGTITFTWSLPADIGVVQSPRTSKIQVAHDTGFTDLVEITPDVFDDENTKEIELLTPGTYYWRVIVMDEAGNITTPTTYFTLTLS
ncbi:MAG: hypothetical protein K0S23_1264 [Fluviicola sp.]|jgi:hypothetical protein|uniref:hypothetical protein n=1 Tax=Fluviicola sp. TaxID=1917219 RepID=UPI002629D66F|nr:hypothetical protein [Fluviicola sp.]MDF3026957.1 hypothetical protein [Fluviicola sp.]